MPEGEGEVRALGDLEQSGDSWCLRFVRNLDHPAEKVWNAITRGEDLAHWFPTRVVGEIRPGAKLQFQHDAIPTFDGEVLVCDPPRVLEIRWGPDIIRFEIQHTADGCTLTFTDTFDDHGKASRDAAGWHECLDLLEYVLSGSTRQWSLGDRWAEVHPSYVAKLGPDASTVGPPEEMLDACRSGG